MFDVGMGEVGLIAVVALLVLGPERLPVAARTVGAVLRKARQSWNSVKTEIERELAAEELKRTLKETTATIDPTRELNDALHGVRADVRAAHDDLNAAVKPAPPAPPPPAADHPDERS